MNVLTATDKHAARWERFVENHEGCCNYHRWSWRRVIENSFGCRTFYLMAMEGDQVKGILPLAHQRSWLFGNFLTSLPFLNSAGIAADGKESEQALLDRAIALAQNLRTSHIELRHRRDHRLELPTKTNKVAVVRPLEPDTEKMWQSLPHKVRTDIRKAQKSGLTAAFGGQDILGDFYSVFAVNMRDLGTPVYSRAFFEEILRAFPEQTYVCVVRHKAQPVAASLLTGYRGTLEAGWSASLKSHYSMKPNMLLYWSLLGFAAARGYRTFDFGRSTAGSGPHRFKLQWRSQTVPLHWVYWLRNGNGLPELNPQNPTYQAAIRLWRWLPVPLTRWIGPRIVKNLP